MRKSPYDNLAKYYQDRFSKWFSELPYEQRLSVCEELVMMDEARAWCTEHKAEILAYDASEREKKWAIWLRKTRYVRMRSRINTWFFYGPLYLNGVRWRWQSLIRNGNMRK